MTSIGPSLALLLGLGFPASMRAGDDDLDVLWRIADPRRFPRGYLAERRQAVERFRVQNRAALARWIPESGGSWTAFYAAARRRRAAIALPALGLLFLLLRFHERGRNAWLRRGATDLGGFLFCILWLAACVGAAYALQTRLRGSFDMSSINHRRSFICFTLLLGAGISLAGAGLHLALRRSLAALLWDLSLLSLLGTFLCIAHPVFFGWHLSFPIPSPPMFFFPYFAALFLAPLNGALLLLLGFWMTRSGESGISHALSPKDKLA
jgi:hypothetical protein